MSPEHKEILKNYSNLLDELAENKQFGHLKKQMVETLFRKHNIPKKIIGRLGKVPRIKGLHGMWKLPKLHTMDKILNTPTDQLSKMDLGLLF